jgi:peptidoglycan/LPS O-acetylase OafA/YrhL
MSDASIDAPARLNGRLRGIDGIRAIAALAILVFHVWDYSAGSLNNQPLSFPLADKLFWNLRAGVTLFFVLSGFLLYRPFAAALIRATPRPSIKRYVINRGLRILPAYWVILILTALVVDHELLTAPGEFAANVLLVQNYVPNYQPLGWSPVGIAAAWSVVIEVSFYAALPFLTLLAIRVSKARLNPVTAALAPATLILLIGIASHIAYRLFPNDLGQMWEKFAIPNYADWFATGMVLAIMRVLWEDGRLRVPSWWYRVAVVAALAMTVASAKLSYQGTLLWNEYQAIVAVAIALLLTLIVLRPADTSIVRTLEWRPLALAGVASYSIFLWNDSVIRGLRDNGLTVSGASGFFVNLALVCVIVGALSWLTYQYVERPALALKQRTPPTEPSTDAEPLGSPTPPTEPCEDPGPIPSTRPVNPVT